MPTLQFTRTTERIATLAGNPFVAEVAILDPEKGAKDSRTFPITYADALAEFPDKPEKDKDKRPTGKRVPLTQEEALDKYVSYLRRMLTEAGNRAEPPVTVRFDWIENDDADEDDEDAPEFIGQFYARPKRGSDDGDAPASATE